MPLELQYQGRKLRQLKREGMIAIYEVLGRGDVLYGYEVIIIKVHPAEEIFGKAYLEREGYPSSAKDSDDWGKIAWSYGRKYLKEALARFDGLCRLEGIPFA